MNYFNDLYELTGMKKPQNEDITNRVAEDVKLIENALMLYKIGELDEKKMLKSIKHSIDLTLYYIEENEKL